MATTRKKKEQEPKKELNLRVEWFPVFGLKLPDFPHVYLVGRTPEEAMIRLAAFMADRGRDNNAVYTAQFSNEPFIVE